MATYKLKRDEDRKFYWTLRSDKNYKTIAMSSESYDSKQGALDSITWMRDNGKVAGFEDEA